MTVGDVVLFPESDKEFDLQYQYGIVGKVIPSKMSAHRFDGCIVLMAASL